MMYCQRNAASPAKRANFVYNAALNDASNQADRVAMNNGDPACFYFFSYCSVEWVVA